MRRDYFTLEVTNVDWVDSDEDPAKPTVTIDFDGPADELRERLTGPENELLDAEETDAAFRLRGPIDEEESTGVVSVTNRVTGDFILELNESAENVLRFITAARRYGKDRGEDDGRYDVIIRINGEELVTYEKDTFLVYGTVLENISYGTFDASREDVVEAAKMAEAHEFIENLPEGYDTEVGERGVKLSGGQRQRISIARAILKDPDILILDEATSDVDTETEMLIQRSIDDLAADRTTFAIAHRLSTIKDADQILVLEDGQVKERGSHEELLANDDLYAHLWGVQAGEIDELPEEFVERAQQRQARTEVSDDD